MELVSSAENSSLRWRRQYSYLEDIGDGRGYTGGIIGFTSGTGDMLRLVRDYSRRHPHHPLARFLPALRAVDGTDSHAGLGRPFRRAWTQAGHSPGFRAAQDRLRDRMYFDPAVRRAEHDGLRTLGQFVYYDAYVVHGPGSSWDSFGGIRRAAMRNARTPAQGGSEVHYLEAVPPRPQAGHAIGGGPPGHLAHRRRPGALPPRTQLRPAPATDLARLRRSLPHRPLTAPTWAQASGALSEHRTAYRSPATSTSNPPDASHSDVTGPS